MKGINKKSLRISGHADCGAAGWGTAYKPEGRGFDSPLCHCNFSFTQYFWLHYGPGVDSASNRNECQEYLLGGKVGRCVRLTTLPPSCAYYLEIGEPQTPGIVWGSNRPLQGLFDLHLAYLWVSVCKLCDPFKGTKFEIWQGSVLLSQVFSIEAHAMVLGGLRYSHFLLNRFQLAVYHVGCWQHSKFGYISRGSGLIWEKRRSPKACQTMKWCLWWEPLTDHEISLMFNPLNAELNPICY
jgi:hypothetical protein